MYRTHARAIAHFTSESPEHTFRAARFVLATIQRHFERVPTVLRELAHGNGRSLTRVQYAALGQYWLRRKEIYQHMQQDSDPDVLLYCAQLPQLGIVKAGFLVQLCRYGSDIGCFDTHNLVMYGIPTSQFKQKPSRGNARDKAKIQEYIALCKDCGGGGKLWDTWCAHVANLRPKSFPGGAEQVSQLHVDCIIP